MSERPSAEIFVLPILMPRDSDALLLGGGRIDKTLWGLWFLQFFLKCLDMREINVSFVEKIDVPQTFESAEGMMRMCGSWN